MLHLLPDTEIVCFYYFICLDQMSPDAGCCQPISAQSRTHTYVRTHAQGEHTHAHLLPVWHATPPTPRPVWKQSNCRPMTVWNMRMWNMSYSNEPLKTHVVFTPRTIEDGQKWDISWHGWRGRWKNGDGEQETRGSSDKEGKRRRQAVALVLRYWQWTFFASKINTQSCGDYENIVLKLKYILRCYPGTLDCHSRA